MNYREREQWAKETRQKLEVLAWGYGNAYNEKGEFVGKTKEPDWVRFATDWEDKTVIQKIFARINWVFLNIKWRFSAVKRHVGNLPKLWKLHCKCKKWNKYLLAEAERTKKLGPANPPTPEEVAKFKEEFDMGWDSQMVQPIKNKRTYFEASLN